MAKTIDALKTMQMDLDSARATQTEIMGMVQRAQELYEGDFHLDDVAKKQGLNRHTKYAQKDIMRVVESSLPDICSPFVIEDDIVVIDAKNAMDVNRAEAMELLINKQFSGSVDKLEFIETIGRDLQIQGTVFTKVGWMNQPIIEVVGINEIFVDPSARSLKDASFVVQRRKVSVHDIMANPEWYGEHSQEVYATLVGTTETEDDVDYNPGYGRDDSFNFSDRARTLIETFEYYGVMDIDGGGSLTPVIGIWSENTLLRFGESPYPVEFNGNPFESCVYTRKSFNVYGGGVSELLETSQQLRQFISSAMIDNVENNNVGQTFIPKNFLDPLNRKKMLNGNRLVEVNGSTQEITKGQFVDMPQSVFAINEQLKMEQEELSGISRLNTGMDPRALNSNVSATAVSTSNDNAAKRLLQITRHISEMLERVFSKWVVLNQTYLEDATVKTRDGEFVPLNANMIQGDFDINIKTGIAGDKDKKLRDLQMMMSLVSTANVNPEIVEGLIAEMAHLLDMPILAQKIMEPKPENPMADIAQSLELAEKQADIEKTQSETMENRADSMKTFVETQNASYGL